MIIGGVLIYIAADLHVSVSQTGQLISVYSLVYALAAPLLLSITARIERKRLYIWSLSVFLAGCLISSLSPNYAVLLLSRIVLAASGSLMTVLSVTIAAKLVTKPFRGRAIGLISMGISGSLVLGVPIGIVVSQLLGWKAIFYLVSALAAITLIGVYTLLPRVASEQVLSIREQLRSLKHAKIISAHMVTILMLAGHLTLYAYLAPFLQTALHLHSTGISLVYFVFGIAAVMGGGIGGWVTDKWPSPKFILVITGVFACALFLLPFAAFSSAVFMVLLALWSLLSWAVTPAQQQYLIRTAPKTSDIQLGLNSSTSHIGIALGSSIGGLVIETYGAVYNAWIGAAIAALAFLCAVYSVARPAIPEQTGMDPSGSH